MNNNELYHYGVKGMKWGVRHNTLSSAASRRIKKMGEKSDPDYRGGRI